MKSDRLTKLLLFLNAVLFAVIAVRLCRPPAPVLGDAREGHDVFVEPGVSMLRAPDGSKQVLGKVLIDLRTGNIWGFPTQTRDPYPVSINGGTKPTVSHPFLLGRYELADMDK